MGTYPRQLIIFHKAVSQSFLIQLGFQRPNSGTLDFGQLEIAWEVAGRKVNSKDMFTAMVDGFVAIAYIDSDDKNCVVFHAVGSPNSTGQVVITVGGDSLHGRLTYGIVRHSLEGIFHHINIGENS